MINKENEMQKEIKEWLHLEHSSPLARRWVLREVTFLSPGKINDFVLVGQQFDAVVASRGAD